MMRVLLILALLLLSSPALACGVLKKSSPAEDSTVAAGALHDVTLTFSDGVLPDKSKITVTDTKGRKFTTGAPYRADGDGKKNISVALKPLPAGTYTVTWDVLCDCDAFSPGSYDFKVGG